MLRCALERSSNNASLEPGCSVTAVRWQGDRVNLSLQGVVGEFEVLGLPSRRGPAAEAQAQFLETPASAERRARLREQQRLAQASRPRPEGRPDKRDRRRLMRLQRDQT